MPGPVAEASVQNAARGLIGQIVTQGRTGLRRKLYLDMRLIWLAFSLVVALLREVVVRRRLNAQLCLVPQAQS